MLGFKGQGGFFGIVLIISTSLVLFPLTSNAGSILTQDVLSANKTPVFMDRKEYPVAVANSARLCPVRNFYPFYAYPFESRRERTSYLNDVSVQGCVTGDCATTTMVSGLPIVQLIVATAAGFIWAAIFIWLYASFYEGGATARSFTEGIWSWFITPPHVFPEKEALKRSGDYTKSGQNLIMITNLALDAIHFLGDKFL